MSNRHAVQSRFLVTWYHSSTDFWIRATYCCLIHQPCFSTAKNMDSAADSENWRWKQFWRLYSSTSCTFVEDPGQLYAHGKTVCVCVPMSQCVMTMTGRSSGRSWKSWIRRRDLPGPDQQVGLFCVRPQRKFDIREMQLSNRYFNVRAKLVSKVAKYPQLVRELYCPIVSSNSGHLFTTGGLPSLGEWVWRKSVL